MNKKRDYKKEYKDFHGKPEQVKNRSMRNAARSKMGLKVGNPKVVDHSKPLSKGGTNHKNNLKVITSKQNLKKGNKY